MLIIIIVIAIIISRILSLLHPAEGLVKLNVCVSRAVRSRQSVRKIRVNVSRSIAELMLMLTADNTGALTA